MKKIQALTPLSKQEDYVIETGDILTSFHYNVSDALSHKLIVSANGHDKYNYILNHIKQHIIQDGGLIYLDTLANHYLYEEIKNTSASNQRGLDFFAIHLDGYKRSDSIDIFQFSLLNTLKALMVLIPDDIDFFEKEKAKNAMKAILEVLYKLKKYKKLFDSKGNHIERITLSYLREWMEFSKLKYLYEKCENINAKILNKNSKINNNPLKRFIQNDSKNFDFKKIRSYWEFGLSFLDESFPNIFDAKNPTINIRKIIMEEKILYVNTSIKGETKLSKKILGRFFATIFTNEIEYAYNNRIFEKNRESFRAINIPYYIFLDGYENFPLEYEKNLKNQARTAGIGIIYIINDLNKFYNFFEKDEIFEYFIKDIRTKIFFSIKNDNITYFENYERFHKNLNSKLISQLYKTHYFMIKDRKLYHCVNKGLINI